jgi:SAM-dependent methyltransferase
MTGRASSRVRYARAGPVHFQPLEWELEQVERYITGRVLNAGCGNRDILPIVSGFGGTELVNYDIESMIPGAVIGSLLEMPFPNDWFDSIVCNAVLEHVPEVDRVMAELVRVLKPGGHLIAGVPYLQPYHLNPTDFRRYTRDGLEELGRLHGLTTVAIFPVHTIAQTLGWIAWEWAKEKGGWRPFVAYPIIWTSTRLFNRTDRRVQNNANTYQAVYTK